MIIIGTAGHIDHGKSAIIKRLTGTDPDRLPEEKKRGMTIDLGFAFLDKSESFQMAFVDVPGHERFVRNMIAGAGGIDAVMLVIAADDGWMPQSEEHFQIVRLLGIKTGLIVINKIDLVEPDWIDLLKQDIKQKVAGSFLEDTPIVPISAQTGEGFDNLKVTLEEISNVASARKDIGKPRLYIDRSFIRQGIGQVVTGTLRGGDLSVGQVVSVWPSSVNAKIRTTQSNSIEVETAVPGQRTAMSLTGLDKDDLVRGGVISGEKDLTFYQDHPILALSIELLPDSPVVISDRRKVLVIIGTTEVEGEVRLFKTRQINPGENGILFFKPDNPSLTSVGDRFIMRLPTPMVTLGGGKVLDYFTKIPRKKEHESLEYLEDRLDDKIESLVVSELKKTIIAPQQNFLFRTDFSHQEIQDAIRKLIKEKIIGKYEHQIFHVEYFKNKTSQYIDTIKLFLKEKPHLKGLSLEEITRLINIPKTNTQIIINYLVATEEMVSLGDKYNIAGLGLSIKGDVKKAYDYIMSELKKERFAPPKLAQLSSGGKQYREAIKFILETGEGYKCGTEFLFLSDVWTEILDFIKIFLTEKDQLVVSDLKDKFGFSRKFVIPILEETDRLKITHRDGDRRVKGDRFES